MPLETGSTIEELDSTWPTGLDGLNTGDNHIRLIKSILKKQFPGVSKNGFSKPITITEDFLNGLPKALKDINDKIDKLYPIGSVVLRMDNINPSTIYGGTWALITGDASLTFGNGQAQNGALSGDNTPVVPLPKHTHGASFTNGRTSGGHHSHGLGYTSGPYGNWIRWNGGTGAKGVFSSGSEYATQPVSTEGSDHSHGVSGTVNISNAGTAGAKINVRGARIAINVWRRTA